MHCDRRPSGVGRVGHIRSVVQNKELSWVGRPTMMASSDMEIQHKFTLEPIQSGTRFHQIEVITDFMIPVSGWILSQAKKGLLAWNEVFEQRLTTN